VTGSPACPIAVLTGVPSLVAGTATGGGTTVGGTAVGGAAVGGKSAIEGVGWSVADGKDAGAAVCEVFIATTIVDGTDGTDDIAAVPLIAASVLTGVRGVAARLVLVAVRGDTNAVSATFVLSRRVMRNAAYAVAVAG